MKVRSLLLLAALLAAGCGGSGLSSPTKGRLTVRSAWGGKGRVIPTAAQSIRVRIYANAVLVNEAILAKATPTTTFSDVPLGNVDVEAVAFPATDATGTAMASGTTTKTITTGTPANVDLTMTSTIDHIVVTPNPVSFIITALVPRSLTVTAYDVSNAVVLTSPSDFTYSTSNILLVSVSSSGIVIGIALGNVTITVTDIISGKSGTTVAKVLPF